MKRDMKGEHKADEQRDESGACGGARPKRQNKAKPKRTRGVPMKIETGLHPFEIYQVI